jgi:hypothetical protein
LSEPELINYHPHSRFRIVPQAFNFPHTDLVHQLPDGPFIDLGIEIDPIYPVWGYLAVDTAIEIGRVLGMSSREDTLAMKARIAELEAQVNAIPEIVKEFQDGLDGYVGEFLGNLDSRIASSVPPVESAQEVAEGQHPLFGGNEPEESGDGGSDSNVPDGDSGQSAGTSVGEGPDELPSNSSNEFGLDFDLDAL